MGIIEKIVNFFFNRSYTKGKTKKSVSSPKIEKSPKLFRTSNYPLYENCSFCDCGDKVYLPFHCEYCDQFFCGKHHLPFHHNCKNIEEYKKTSFPVGFVTESKGGELFVRK